MAQQTAIILYGEDHEETHQDPYVHTPHIASALVDDAFYNNYAALEEAIERAVAVCLYLGVPIEAHFRPVHVHDTSTHLRDDWALSDLAFYLLLLNGRHSDQTAYAQAWIIRQAFAGRH